MNGSGTFACIPLVLLSGCLLSVVATGDTPAGFEIPPDQAPGALLPASLVSGPNYQVDDPVRSDGLMHRYVVDSRFGKFKAYGRAELDIRVHEIAALTELSKISTIAVVAGGVGRGIGSQAQTVAGVVTHPVATITGIPRGIKNLFHGYVDEGKETAREVRDASASTTGTEGSTTAAAAKGQVAAKRYASRYFGLGSAERHWYQKLGVDPYTDNSVLRDAIHRTARVDAAAGFGMRFAGIPSIPGIGDVHQVMDAIYNEDPATIRARTKATLAGYGLTSGEIERWQNVLVLSPTRQMLLLKLAAALDGVDGRGELFRHAIGLTSDGEAQVYLHSVGLLVLAHRQQPVAAILSGVRLPAARRADGSVVVSGAFEAVYWTADVESGEKQIREALAPFGRGPRELWLAGSASERVRAELRERGWTLHETVQDPALVAVLH